MSGGEGAPIIGAPPLAPLRHILFATDLSAASEAAFAHARLLADCFGAEVTVYHALRGEGRASGSHGQDEPNPTAAAVGDELRRRCQVAAGACRIVIEPDAGPEVDQALVGFVRGHRPDLVVMANRGRTGFGGVGRGSVTERVLRQCVRPLLCVPPSAGRALPYRRILVPTDLSESSLRALPWATRLAGAFHGRILAFHATPAPACDPMDGDAPRSGPDEDHLRSVVAPHVDPLFSDVAVSAASPAWSAIVHEILEQQRDLVVMTGAGRSQGDPVRCSTTERVIRHSPVPVLVI